MYLIEISFQGYLSV